MDPLDRWNQQADVVDLNQWLEQQRRAAVPPAAQSKQPTTQKKKKGFWLDQISTVGGILGGIGGSFIAPVAGTAGGAAAGSALGETLENALTGSRLLDNVGKEAILGGVFSLPPLQAGKAAFGALRGVGAGTRAASSAGEATLESALKTGTQMPQAPLRTSAQGKATELGNRLLTAQYGTISKPVARQTRPEQTFGQLADLGLTKPQDVERVAEGITGAQGVLNRAVVNATGNSKRVDVNGLRQTLTDSMANNGVVGKEAKELTTMFDAQMARLLGGPKGSLDPTADPSDVLDVMKAFEARIAQKTGKGGNYRLPTDQTVNQANALGLVKDELQSRLESGADVSKVLTPRLREELLGLAPGNRAWQSYVDNTVMKSADIASLRTAQAPFVNAKQIIDEADVNSMTFGGRAGNAAGNVREALQNALVGAAKNPASRAAAVALRRSGGQGMSATPTAVPSRAGIVGRLGALGAISGGYNQLNQVASQERQSTPNSSIAAALSAAPAPAQLPQQTMYSKESALGDIQRDPENADYYMQLYEFANPEIKQTGSEAPYGKPTAQQYSQANTALQSIDSLEQLLESDGSVPARNAIPGQKLPVAGSLISRVAGTGQYRALANNILNSIARVNTGANMPESEREFYESTYLPQPGESAEARAQKIANLRQFFSPIAYYGV